MSSKRPKINDENECPYGSACSYHTAFEILLEFGVTLEVTPGIRGALETLLQLYATLEILLELSIAFEALL